MRGQKLFIRPIESADREAIIHFLREQSGGLEASACGLLGKLLGRLVAVVATGVFQSRGFRERGC